ncbi:FeoC-like transcriptional regulator [Salinivibrio sp. ES.052]|uniref:FeoC-like transcriptional regulator n=1 Tax=Salinivibrio sp. ES.052 TaxID=1882823 RepID=UPI0009261A5B|nr:FeoC-like transcriptional regulator [Salinivibrio sp. ES.052]SIN80753.1 putative ferrous iron transport protein C [Salinivibrio sp. ES.052]
MILQKLKTSVIQAGVISRRELANTYGLSPDGVEAMMETWIKRGVIIRQCACQGNQDIQYRLAHANEIQCLSMV